MISRLRKGLILLVIVSIGAFNTGCIFGDIFEIFASVNEEDDSLFVSMSAKADVNPCSSAESFEEFIICSYLIGGLPFDSSIGLNNPILLLAIILDPLVLQLPEEASNFAGSYSESISATGGDLVITSGLTSFMADNDTTITAEPGTQFVILDLPDEAPTEGEYAFNFNFDLPPGLSELNFKPMLTGKVVDEDKTFYPPLLPCETSFTDIPELSVPLPNGGQIQLPLDGLEGCNNVVYNFANGSVTAIPTLSNWSMIALSAVIAASGLFFLIYRRTKALS